MMDRFRMSSSNTEFEEVKIGNWETQLPSEMCTNKNIFSDILSLETWNNVLLPEQRLRLIKLLPKEISGNSESSMQTITELFKGSLTQFSISPVDSFFEKLEQGMFDPEVILAKCHIKNALKKESLRQLKSYHLKLLEEIVVSRQNFLNKIRASSNLNDTFSKIKIPPLEENKTITEKTLKPTDISNPNKRKLSFTSGEDGPSNSAKVSSITSEPLALNSSPSSADISFKEDKITIKFETSQNHIPVSQPPLVDLKSLKDPQLLPTPTELKTLTCTTAPTIKSESNFPIKITYASSSSFNSSMIQSQQSQSQSQVSSQVSNIAKGSPILASQLQSPTQTMWSTQSQSPTVDFKKFEDKSSEDDLETSSDEFEAIEPTIGFELQQASPKVQPQIKSIAPIPLMTSTPTHRMLTPTSYSSPVLIINSNKMMTTTAGSTSGQATRLPLHHFFPSSSTPGIGIKTDSPTTILKSEFEKALLQSGQIIVTSSPSSNGTPGTKQVYVTSTCGTKLIKLEDVRASLAAAASTNSGFHFSSTGGSLNLNMKQESITKLFTTSTASTLNAASVSGTGTPLRFVPTLVPLVQKPKSLLESDGSSTSLRLLNENVAGDDLNLSFGSLGGLGSLSMNSLDDSSCDVMNKISDDLSVLDGNPFDSIPNLSDELDGLDLDLVDGLCDFEGLLSDERKYPSFFSLIRDVLCSTRDHRMTLTCLEKTIRKWSVSAGAALNHWFLRVCDWNIALVTALNFLAGSYQVSIPQLTEDFVPYIEYKYKTKYYQWIGAGRDGDNNLLPLCNIWMDNLEQLPSIKKEGETEENDEEDEDAEESDLLGEESKKRNKRPLTPPPPRFVTDWSVRPSSEDEKSYFREQERGRFESPHKAFTYKMHGYESVVGPVKGVYSSQVGMTNKARGHSLLVDDRPPYVTILALVRDAVARLPNGEGTRSEICEMLRDSAFLAPDASSVTLNSVVSGALDRLHYERDPCVRYDSHKKSWIYLHRDRTQEQFERLHHNRSYTKSTKCRNNSARKFRSKGGGGKNQGNDGTSSSTTASSADASSLEQRLGITEVVSPSSSTTPASNLIPSSFTSSIIKVPDPTTKPPEETAILATKVSSGEIRFDTTTQSFVTTSTSGSKISPSSTGFQHLILQTTKLAPTSTISGIVERSPIQIHTTATQPTTSKVINSLTVSQSSSSVNVGLVSNSSTTTTPTSTSSPTTTTPATFKPGHFVLGPSTVLRLANALRLSQLRLPAPTGTTNSVRLPQQHSILFTSRGPVLGPSQTQGPNYILGRTASGQPIIISTGPPGSINPFQVAANANTTQGGSISMSTIGGNRTLVLQQHQQPLQQNKPQPTASSISVTKMESESLTSVSPGNLYNLKSVPGQASIFTTTAASVSGLTTSASIQTQAFSLTSTSLATSLDSNKSVTILTSSAPTQTTGLLQHHLQQRIDVSNSSSSSQSQQIQNIQNPFILRSPQGGLVIPCSLVGRGGVQGIRIIPMQENNKLGVGGIPLSVSSAGTIVTTTTAGGITPSGPSPPISTPTTSHSN